MAGNLFSAVLPEMTADNFAHAIECYQDIALSNGVTIAFEPMFDKKQNYDRRFAGYAKLNSVHADIIQAITFQFIEISVWPVLPSDSR